jgi:hypothetical protein
MTATRCTICRTETAQSADVDSGAGFERVYCCDVCLPDLSERFSRGSGTVRVRFPSVHDEPEAKGAPGFTGGFGRMFER